MSRPKPGIGRVELNAGFLRRLSDCLEVVMGRRGGRVKPIGITALKVSAGPTADEFNKVVDDLNTIKATINTLLEQVQD